MATNVTWNGTTYSIPAANELNWSTLSSFLIALGNGAAVTEEMKQAIRVATTSPVTVAAATDFCVVTDLSVAGAVAVNLPAGVNGQLFVIADGKGDAATNNITITPNGAETINGAANYVINDNRGSVVLAYSTTGTKWTVVARFVAGALLTNPLNDGLVIDGASDEIQLRVQGHTTQTNDILVVETSAGADVLSVAEGGTTSSRKVVIDGTANEIQLRIQGHTTQTANYFVVENSAGADLVAVGSDGTILCSPSDTTILAYSNTDSRIVSNTPDGSDSLALAICGGGSPLSSRGGYIRVYGNEHASAAGRVDMVAGSTAGAIQLAFDYSGGTAGTVNNSGVWTFYNGAKLKNSGAGSTVLDYYEEGQHTLTFGAGDGIFSAQQDVTVNYVRIGKMVTLQIPARYATADATPGSVGSNSVGTNLPSSLQPVTNINHLASVTSGGVDLAGPGVCAISTTGVVSFYHSSVYTTLWSSSGTNGFAGISLTYRVA